VPPVRVRAHALAAGALEVRGDGPAATLVEAHLGPEVGDRPVWVVVELVDGGGPPIEDGDLVRLACPPGERTMAPILAAIELAAARRGAVLAAGAAKAWDDRVVIARGTSGAGKTGVLLRALERGASLVAPESCWIDADARVWPLPQPLRVRPHHRRSPVVRAAVRRPERWRLAGGHLLPGRWSRRAFVDLPLDRIEPPSHPPDGWRFAGYVDVDGRGADAVVDEAALLAHRSSGTGGLVR
jgi:hypothetical protein